LYGTDTDGREAREDYRGHEMGAGDSVDDDDKLRVGNRKTRNYAWRQMSRRCETH